MKIVIIVEVLPPHPSSAAVQMYDLAEELVNQNFEVTILATSPDIRENYKIKSSNGIQIIYLKTPKTKDINYIRRFFAELYMPFAMLKNLKKTKFYDHKWEYLIWYSPTIFHGPLVNHIKKLYDIRSYLIIRDIFPEWALDIGLIKKGLIYNFLKVVARYQYSLADTIGIQSTGNKIYFKNWLKKYPTRKLELLNTWLGDKPEGHSSINIKETKLSGRKIFVYTGNIGIAQDMNILIELADRIQHRHDIGFLFVGRGDNLNLIKNYVVHNKLTNTLIFDSINPNEISGLLSQCHVGMVSLNVKHNTHNIPGKFLSYIQAGLPVLASINPGNDLVKIINENKVGAVITNRSLDDLTNKTEKLLAALDINDNFFKRSKNLYKNLFSSKSAVNTIKKHF